MAKLTQRQFDNCKKGLEILREAPERQLNLETYKETGPCGTLFCSLGWLTESGKFVGLVWSPEKHQGFNGIREFPLLHWDAEDAEDAEDIASKLFGEGSWSLLFQVRGLGDLATEQIATNTFATDKQLAILRFEKWIADATVQD